MTNFTSGFNTLLRAMLLLPFLLMLNGCTEEEQPVQQVGVIEPGNLNRANQVEFVRQMVTDYLELSDQLVVGYETYKEQNDYEGYIGHRNLEWTPAYIAAKQYYQGMLHRQKPYIYRNQLGGLFELFMNLQKLALHLKHSLRDSDWKLEQQVKVRLARDASAVTRYLRARSS